MTLPPDKVVVAYRIFRDPDAGDYVLQFDIGGRLKSKRFATEEEADATVKEFMREFNGKVIGRG